MRCRGRRVLSNAHIHRLSYKSPYCWSDIQTIFIPECRIHKMWKPLQSWITHQYNPTFSAFLSIVKKKYAPSHLKVICICGRWDMTSWVMCYVGHYYQAVANILPVWFVWWRSMPFCRSPLSSAPLNFEMLEVIGGIFFSLWTHMLRAKGWLLSS